jgi:predicted DNA-binding transcriptional regulator AlpA
MSDGKLVLTGRSVAAGTEFFVANDAKGNEYIMRRRLWNVSEVAEFLGLAVGSIYHLVSQRRIPCVRLSARCLRFDPEAIAVWVNEKSKKGEMK